MPIAPAAALASLSAHPRTFLRRYPVRIAGAPVASGVLQYYIYNRDFGPSQRPGSILRTRRMHATEAFYIDNQNMPGGHAFAAYSVQMVQSNVAPIVLYTIPGVGGPNLMVTGALTGCSFIVEPGPNGDIDCAHLQPNGENAIQLQNRLLPNYTTVYGRNQYRHVDPLNPVVGGNPSYDRTVTIIGVRQNGQWKVYAQKLDTLNAMSIRSVHRIHPPE